MKNTFKRLLALVLIVTALGAYLVPGAAAAKKLTDAQEAVIETALAYYNKGAYIQYDSTQMTAQSRLSHGESRTTSGRAPEWAAEDETLFSVCSDFVYSVYYNALGMEIYGGSRGAITSNMAEKMDPKEPTLVYYYGGLSGNMDMDSLINADGLLEPGDVVTYYRNDKSGHATLYVGDVDGDGKGDIIHCNGKKIDLSTGQDAIDNEPNGNGGAIRIDSAESLIFGEDSLENKANFTSLTILRPLMASNVTITPAAKTRVKYQGIEIDRMANLWKYNSAEVGEEIKVTLSVINNGKRAFEGIPVIEPLPVGATVNPDSISEGGKLTANGIEWTVNVPRREEVKLTYTATVTASIGQTVRFPSGTAENLTFRPMEFKVGGKPLDTARLTMVRKGNLDSVVENLKFDGDLDFVNVFYREILGIELNLPKTIQELVDNMHTPTKLGGVSSKLWNGQMLVPKKMGEMSAKYQHVMAMMLPEHMAGWAVYTRDSLTEVPKETSAQNRATELLRNYYKPGDIFFGYVHKDGNSFTVSDPDVFIYLGSRKALGWSYGSGIVEVDSFEDTIGMLLREDVMFALRPSLLYKDINSNKKASFSDVKASDWYHSYVCDLVADGTVAGTSATTYAPNGTLTYAAALKLLVVGLTGKDPGNGDGHWAANYLAEAKAADWTDIDAAKLDAPITREAFCEIAAKAKGLTEQPASNPFTDTANTSVLALVKAGVISGMSADKFAPTSTLTRAQIAKIIWLLNRV